MGDTALLTDRVGLLNSLLCPLQLVQHRVSLQALSKTTDTNKQTLKVRPKADESATALQGMLEKTTPLQFGHDSQVSCLQRSHTSSSEHHSIIMTHTHISGLVPHTSGIGQHKGVLVFMFGVDCGSLLEEGMDQEVWEGKGGEGRRGEGRGEEGRREEGRGSEGRGREGWRGKVKGQHARA